MMDRKLSANDNVILDINRKIAQIHYRSGKVEMALAELLACTTAFREKVKS
jgi:hypothetical protein